MKSATFTVIIPAFNEEAVIERTLDVLLGDAEAVEFEVIVVCNGCNDDTAARVRSKFPRVTVVEIEEASKTAAINKGISTASDGPVLLLDADIELDTRSARAMIAAVIRPGIDAAIGHMSVDTEGADWIVRAFYRVWMEHPYLRNGKFAAAIALSDTGRMRVGTLPAVTADDTYLRRIIPTDRVAVARAVSFGVRAPRTDAIAAAGALTQLSGKPPTQQLCAERMRSQERLADYCFNLSLKPALWLYVPIYLAVTLIGTMDCLTMNSGIRWERDLTTRMKVAE